MSSTPVLRRYRIPYMGYAGVPFKWVVSIYVYNRIYIYVFIDLEGIQWLDKDMETFIVFRVQNLRFRDVGPACSESWSNKETGHQSGNWAELGEGNVCRTLSYLDNPCSLITST